ncbi:MAG: P-II family nitrogen regulator [Treponema sp.]|nr:P-II family nitrogen regulator [Treponema sp.]
MKQVIIIIRTNHYFKTRNALQKANFGAISEKEILGRGKKSGHYTAVTGEESFANYSFSAKRMIEIYVRDEDVDRLIKTVVGVNRTGTQGDGKIFVLPAESVIRIRTGEKNIDAIM